jgi:hypothetical protein
LEPAAGKDQTTRLILGAGRPGAGSRLLVLGGGDFWLTAIPFLIILLFVADNQVERELVNVIEVEFLGAANNRHILDRCVRMNAKAGTAVYPSRQSQVKQQLRLRGNEGTREKMRCVF